MLILRSKQNTNLNTNILYLNPLIIGLVLWSQSYYIFDLFNYNKRADKWLMIAHHIGSIACECYIMRLCDNPYDINGRAVLLSLFWCEISNYPIYFVYHITHSINGKQNINPVYCLYQSLSFFILRGKSNLVY